MTQEREDWLIRAGERARALRDRLGLSQRALAEKSGVSRPTIANLEAGKSWPNPTTRIALGVALECEDFGRFLLEGRR